MVGRPSKPQRLPVPENALARSPLESAMEAARARRAARSLQAAPAAVPATVWSGSYPVEALPQWLRFYRALRDRKGGVYAAFYAETVASLEALSRELARAA